MFQNFRLSMAWLHTWFGLVLGFVLMAAFFFGALSVFDRAMPARFDTPTRWGAYTTHRDPVLSLFAGYDVPNAKLPETTIWASRTIDPRSGASLPDDRLKVGSGFFYPMHYSLTLGWKEVGTWIVGFSALVMLAALVSGVVMHRKLFRELFTFRPGKSRQRSILDMHNLTGVVALPFHFFFAFTGLVIFAGVYFPVGHTQLQAMHDHHEKIEAKETGLPHDRAGVAAPFASVDAMVAEARRRWAARGMAGDVGFLAVQHPGDANGYVSVYRAGTDRIALTGEGVHFKASTGALIREDPPRTAVDSVNTFLTGLHLQHFRHWLLRWLYVLGGLLGCVCIATGMLFYVEKRKRQHAVQGIQGARVVDALAVSTVTGMLVATLAILIANRLLPDTLPPGWPERGLMERYFFWGAWLLAMLHAFWRSAPVAQGKPAPAWREQCLAVSALAVVAVLLNWLTTGDHLVRTLAASYWPVAGVDLFMLTGAVIALLVARRLRQRSGPVTLAQPGTAEGAHA